MGRHGHTTDYQPGCVPCRERALTQDRRRRLRLYPQRVVDADGRLRTTRDVPHGRPHTYTHYGCRCVACSTAHSRYLKNWRRGFIVADLLDETEEEE